jgi:hypothetical protein
MEWPIIMHAYFCEQGQMIEDTWRYTEYNDNLD